MTDPDAQHGQKWVAHWTKRLRAQTDRRPMVPPVYGNGAIEARLTRVRAALESRRWTFRNRTRMNLPLELIRLADLRADNATIYATDIRHHLTETVGRAARTYRAIYDVWGPKGTEHRTYSLWASPAEKAARELRSKHRKETGKPPKVERAGKVTTIRLS